MSKLEQMINELCPNGVEYKAIQSFSQLLKGMSGVSNKWADDGNCQFIEYKNAYDNLKIDVTRLPFATVKKIENQVELKQGDILFTSASETPDECAISSVIEDEIDERIFIDDHLFGIRVNDKTRYNPIFLNYYFRSDSFRRIVNKTVRGVTRYYISIPNFMKLQIPIPPLPIQEEIVRILDKFTELTVELTVELTARKQQYEYYRDRLISFKNDMTLVELGKLATDMYRGSGIKRDEVSSEGIPCVRYGEIYTTYNVWFDKCVSKTMMGSKTFEYGDVLFAITGESVEEIAKSCAYVGNEKCFAGGDIVVMKHEQNPKYMAYALSTTMAQKQKSKERIKSKVVHSNIPAIKEIKIPIPFPNDTAKSLAEQQRIVNVLDNFEAICSDLQIGLPAEIEARQKQYEYYRDLLLSFDSSQFVNVERERER